MALFFISYDVSKYQLSESKIMRNLANPIKSDLKNIIGGEQITESSIMVELFPTNDNEKELTCDDVFDIIFDDLLKLKNKTNGAKYKEADLAHLRLAVVQAHNDEIILTNPVYQEQSLEPESPVKH